MAPPLITARQLGLRFGEKSIFSGLDFSIHEGERICLVGRNGSGKSTLLKVVAGLVEADEGDFFVQPGTKIAYLPQEPDFTPYATLKDYVVEGLFEDQEGEEYRADAALSLWDLDPDESPQNLSGGEKRRAAIARALACEPDILLLDEPTNHLDLTTIEKLEEALKSFRGCFVLISHDRAFLQHLTEVTLWLDRGVVRRLNKGYKDYDSWAEEILEHEAREREKMDKLIAVETTWSHQGITARRKRNQGRLRRLYELRDQRSSMTNVQGRAKLEIDAGAVSGKLVAEAKHITKSYGGLTIINDFSTRIVRGDRIGIIGPNGAGKSTLLKLLTGEIKPDSGHIRIGKNLTTVYFDQSRQLLEPEKTLWETLCERGTDQVLVKGHPRHVVSYLRDFLFDAGQARSPVKSLSGGEKSRLLLAKTLAKPSNVLILDEPTNDLDMDTLDLLQEVLSEYDGTLIIVSHDRDFLDQVVTSTIVFEGKGELTEYAGGYTDYLRQRNKREEQSPVIKASKSVAFATPKVDKPVTRLSFKHHHRYTEIPKLLETFESRLKTVESQLESAELYQKNPQEFQRLGQEHQHIKEQMEALELEWLEIEEMKSSFEGC